MHGDYYLNRRFSDEYLEQLAAWMTVMFLAVVLGFVVNQVIMSSAGASLHKAVREDVTGLEKENATRKAKEGASSSINKAGKITVCCCVAASMIVIMAGAIVNLRKESVYGQR